MIPLFQCGFAIGMLFIKSSERASIVNVHVQINEKVTKLVTFVNIFSIPEMAMATAWAIRPNNYQDLAQSFNRAWCFPLPCLPN